MAKCKICGQPVRSAPVFHPACWETVTLGITVRYEMGENA